MHLRESRTSKFSGLRQIYPPVTLKYPLVQKLIETPVYCMMYLDTTDTVLVLVSILMPKLRQPTCLWNKNGFPKYSQLYKTAFCVDWCDFFTVDRNM